ncbi:unnamed protein product [Notodromas monacha]|uniref:Trehalase n=1 Tax=Notodromas monacha TaxID=399045 RepID=A0A7R9BX94_9CRUS|nr:unnamed protein product [Notodromas monacha]CAG0922079.1 unnamed protein product [Notodromas monacha]
MTAATVGAASTAAASEGVKRNNTVQVQSLDLTGGRLRNESKSCFNSTIDNSTSQGCWRPHASSDSAPSMLRNSASQTKEPSARADLHLREQLVMGTEARASQILALVLVALLSGAIRAQADSDFPPPCEDVDSSTENKLANAGVTLDWSEIPWESDTIPPPSPKNRDHRLGSAPLSRVHIQSFVDQHFDPPGSELEIWTPPDWKPTPKFLDDIKNQEMREFAAELHNLWKQLGRKVKDTVRDNADRYSILYVPHGTMVPGGRFREFYYWKFNVKTVHMDTYWVVKALLISGMSETVKGMLINFVEMQRKFGYIPNGGRKYFARRSQPPYFIPMVNEYV